MFINIEGDVRNNKINLYQNHKKKKNLLEEISNQLINLQEDKFFCKTENEKNRQLRRLLRARDLLASEEVKQGRSGTEKKENFEHGRLDIAMFNSENSQIVESIIEAFELTSLGEKDKIVKPHIDKLIYKYDTAGNEENFVVIYSKAKGFFSLWNRYKNYVNRNIFPNESDIEEVKMSKSDIRIGLNYYKRNNKKLKLYHLFVNMNTE